MIPLNDSRLQALRSGARSRQPALMRKLTRRNLAPLMALYDENYQLFFRRVGAPRALPLNEEQVATGPFPLFLTLLEENPYTSTLLLTYRFVVENGEDEEPSAKIRLYHDSHQCEVMSMSQGESLRSFLSLVKSGEENLDARWRLNLFLNHWLRHCIEQKYQF